MSQPGYDDDCEDQGLMATTVCRRFQCQKWTSSNEVSRPTLVKRGRFWCCPVCHHSYGEHAHG